MISFEQVKPGMIITKYKGNSFQRYWIIARRTDKTIYGVELMASESDLVFYMPAWFEAQADSWKTMVEDSDVASSNELRFAIRVLFNAKKFREDW